MRVRFTTPAASDVAEAVQWYRRHRAGLDQRFLQAIDDATRRLSENPLIGTVVDERIRRHLLKSFPYALFYLLVEGEIVVIGCFHGARDPESWPID